MSELSQRIISRYVLIAVVGTILILAVTPVIRVTKVYLDLARIEGLVHENRYGEAIAEGGRIEIWASLHPAYARRLNCILVKCHAALDDQAGAERLAREIRDRPDLEAREAVNIWEIPETPIVDLINMILSKLDADMGLTPWSGYEALIGSLKDAARYDRMDSMVKELLAANPSNKCGLSARHYLEQRGSMPLASRPQTEVTVPKTPSGPRVNHFELARKYLAEKDWNKAIEECELAQAENPQDLRIRAMKKTASARDKKWAIAGAGARAYDRSGNFLHVVEPGTVIEITSIDKTVSGEIAVCRISTPSGDNSSVLVRTKDLEVRPGVLGEISDKEKSLRSRKVQLLAEIEKVNSDIAASRSKENPHADEYNKAMGAHRQFWAKKNEVEAKFKKTTGEERMAFADELRMMKGQDITIGKNLEQAKKKYDQWLADHPYTGPADPRMEPLKTALASVKDQLVSIEEEQ